MIQLKICRLCQEEKSEKCFYSRSGNSCKKCMISSLLIKQKRFKLECLDYKGNKCIKCGYDNFYGALEFHHRNMEEKEFGISRYTLLKLNEEVKLELDKCDLLCSNCHREIHYLKEKNE